MELKFSPNNLQASKYLFTGRTDDLEKIFSLILSGNCVAIFGERRSGKSLTLEMINAIINGDIIEFKEQLIDKRMLSSIPYWIQQFVNYKSIYITLHGTRTEEDLKNSFRKSLSKIYFFDSNPYFINEICDSRCLEDFLDYVHSICSNSKKKMVILIDEMEILGDYKERCGIAISEIFCNRNRYPDFIFVHAGSYQWDNSISSPGSLFTHLEPHYLRSINEKDTINFLLDPLKSEEMKYFVVTMSGSKPLYVQFMGNQIYYSVGIIEEEDLYKNLSLCSQIDRNIFNEKRVDYEAKLILSTLAHHDNVTEKWISEKLGIGRDVIRKNLKLLVRFGTISENSNRYRIVGKFIESFGKKEYNDPCKKTLKSLIKTSVRFLMMMFLMVLVILLYRYVHPGNRPVTFKNSNMTIKIAVPKSLEVEEEGNMPISVSNISNKSVNSLILIFRSDHIWYSKDGKDTILLTQINPNQTAYSDIHFRVLTGEKKIKSFIIIANSNRTFEFDIIGRPLPLKNYLTPLSVILTFLGIIIPGKEWKTVFSLLINIIQNKSEI